MDYVTCLLHNAIQFKDSIFPGAKCAKDLQLPNWNVIEECANSTEGSKLLQDYGVRTSQLNPTLSFVPTITFNHVGFLIGSNSLHFKQYMITDVHFGIFFIASRPRFE